MAEYALRSLLERERPNRTEIISAGTLGLEGQPATPYAQEASKMWDLDLSPHRNQPLTRELVGRADLIFCMASEHFREVVWQSDGAQEKTYLLKNFPDSSPDGDKIADPIGMELDYYNEVFLEIGEYLGLHLNEIARRIDGMPNA